MDVAGFGLLKALAEAFGTAIDWFSDLSIQILRALCRNPALGIVVATALLFAVARIRPWHHWRSPRSSSSESPNFQVDAVTDGQSLHPQFVPWKAEAVKVHWNPGDSHMKLPPSDSLVYLGEGDARVVFYDTTRNETYRINSKGLELEFPEDC